MASSLAKDLTALAASEHPRTVVCSVHQPPGDVFERFDGLLLLSAGRTVYFGPQDGNDAVLCCDWMCCDWIGWLCVDVVAYCSRIGVPCSPDTAIAEHLLERK